MTLLLTCAEVSGNLTDYMEGAVPSGLKWRLWTHLAICPGCQALLRSLEALPKLLHSALLPSSEPPPEAIAALRGALAKLGGPRPEQIPPAAVTLPPEGRSDSLFQLLARTQIAVTAGQRPSTPPYLPLDVLEDLPPQAAWSWWGLGLGGGRMAKLKTSQDGRHELYFLKMPPFGRFPKHGHAGAESLLVLQGGLEDGGRHGQPGDCFHHAEDHPDHAPVADPTGCWALIWAETGAVQLRGWRRVAQVLLT